MPFFFLWVDFSQTDLSFVFYSFFGTQMCILQTHTRARIKSHSHTFIDANATQFVLYAFITEQTQTQTQKHSLTITTIFNITKIVYISAEISLSSLSQLPYLWVVWWQMSWERGEENETGQKCLWDIQIPPRSAQETLWALNITLPLNSTF